MAAVDYYVAEADERAALAFVAALEEAYDFLARQPRAGSPRYGQELALPGLRHWSTPGFPYLIFYVERSDHLDVWRVLHSRRDIPASMQASE